MKNNKYLNNLINNYTLNIQNLNINNISNIINEELDNMIENISYKKINENKIINELNEYKNEINLIYYANNNSICSIFGDEFVYENKNNIELKIN